MGYENGNCNEIGVFYTVGSAEHAIPQPKHIKKLKLLCVQEGKPTKTVEKWLDFEII